MKKLFLTILVMVLMASMAFASPFLVCDPQDGVVKYRIDGTEIIDAETDGSVKYDISSIPAGDHNGTLEAGNEYVLDGVPQGVWQWSEPTPFVLTVPAKRSAPTNTGLTP